MGSRIKKILYYKEKFQKVSVNKSVNYWEEYYVII